MAEKTIYCCECGRDVGARLTDGREIYPHRTDLRELPFWKCDECGNSVGCHHKTKDRTRPLGCIPSFIIKEARKELHKLLDPIWKAGRITRKEMYQKISVHLGYEYHAANIRSIEEANKVYKYIWAVKNDLE